MRIRSKQFAGWVTIGGVLVFLTAVVTLHFLERDYDPVRQMMSELALGRYGYLMDIAFAGLAVSILGTQYGLASLGAPFGLRALLVVAALSLFGAGLFRLGDASRIHVAFVAVAFVSLALAMYLLARLSGMLVSRPTAVLSLGLSAATALSAALGSSIIPVGIGQRAATVFMLIWLGVLGRVLVRNE
jgi:hypothetical protein